MGLDSGKHIEKEVNEVKCRIIETGIEKKRADFLKELLEINGLVAQVQELEKKEETEPTTYVIGVTDLTFNAVLAVYEHKLLTKDGRYVSPAYWNQLTDKIKLNYLDVND